MTALATFMLRQDPTLFCRETHHFLGGHGLPVNLRARRLRVSCREAVDRLDAVAMLLQINDRARVFVRRNNTHEASLRRLSAPDNPAKRVEQISRYSYLNATIGSTFMARRAGM